MPTTYAIPDGRTVMAATLWTGTGATLSINNAVNGVNFQPDFVWAKSRSSAESHRLEDSVRGATKALYSNLTNAEATEAQSITAFNSTGFTLGTGTPNTSAVTYVGWQWKANGSAVSNTSGSITSQVNAGTSQGFSVVTYTGTGANATVGHGLGVAPKMVIVKTRSVGTYDWCVYHANLTSASYYIPLNGNAAQTLSTNVWNATAPTSSVFSIGTSVATNQSGQTLVAYCWAEVAGFSKFGSYTGNGSADGPFVYLGFRPRWVMIKNTTSGSGYDWEVYDTSRGPYNLDNQVLYPDLSNAEATPSAAGLDILSNGFKVRFANGNNNPNGATMIYAAFAENPFKYANAR